MKTKILNVSINKEKSPHTYPIYVGDNLLQNAGQLLKYYILNKKVILIYDSFFSNRGFPKEIFNQFLKSIEKHIDAIKLIPISGGDKSKNMTQIITIVENSLAFKVNRDSIVIAFGGGVIGDIAGFVSSILLRGIDFIQIPTTLLSQVDSSVGGKTGVNSEFGKNLIGSFHQPIAVIADINVLDSLPKREFRAGFSEVIKYGLISDINFFKWLEKEYENILNKDKKQLQHVITKSCSIKSDIIKDDEKENNKRALLNLGHTFAHAIENLSSYDGKIVHGEAVAIGICMAFKFSLKLGFCKKIDTERVINIFEKSKLPTSLRCISNLSISTIVMLDKFKYDKKVRENKLTFILNKSIGDSFVNHNINIETLTQFLNEEI